MFFIIAGFLSLFSINFITRKKMFNLGLIGKNLKYSFSKNYFKLKFKNENLNNFKYELYELKSLKDFSLVLKKYYWAKCHFSI